jgi:hypothetical protein
MMYSAFYPCVDSSMIVLLEEYTGIDMDDQSEDSIDKEQSRSKEPSEITGRYADPKQREELINRLLAMSEQSIPSSVHPIADPSATTAAIEVTDTSASRSDQSTSNSLYFASDIAEQNPKSHPLYNLSYSNILPPKDPNIPKPSTTEAVNRPTSRRRHRSTSPAMRPRVHLKSREDLLREADEEFKRTHHFQPKLIARSPSPSPTKPSPTKPSPEKQPVLSSIEIKRSEDELQHEYSYGYSNRNARIKSRIDEMLYQYEKKLKQRELQRREEENIELLECTFTPSITRKAEILATRSRRERSRSADAATHRLGQATSEKIDDSISNRLHEDAIKRIEQHKWLSKHVEEARAKYYTFQPAINPNTSAILSSKHQRSRSTRIQEIFNRYTNPEHETLNEVESGQLPRPLHERVVEVQREQSKKLLELRSEYEEKMQANMTFRPAINSMSKHLAEKRMRQSIDDLHHQLHPQVETRGRDRDQQSKVQVADLDVGTRLQLQGKLQAKHLQELQVKYETEQARKLEMSRYHNSNTQRSRPNSPTTTSLSSPQEEFHERQRHHVEKVKQKHERYHQAQETEYQHLFQPKILHKSKALVKEKYPERIFESINERVERLTFHDQYQRRVSQESVRRELEKELTFHPKLNDMTHAIGQRTNLEELHQNYRGKKVRERIKEKVEEKYEREYTFHPKITDYYASKQTQMHQEEEDAYQQHYGYDECPADLQIRSSEDASQRIKRRGHSFINLRQPERMKKAIDIYMREKEETLQAEMIAREIKELDGCTFSPEITGFNYKQRLRDEPVIVRGLGRHLQLRDLSMRKKEEVIEREREVFRVQNLDKYRRPEDGSTIVEPFNLSDSYIRN